MLDQELREESALDLTGGFSALAGQVLESQPDQHGTADVVSLDSRPAALAVPDSGELLFFAVKLPGLPALQGEGIILARSTAFLFHRTLPTGFFLPVKRIHRFRGIQKAYSSNLR